VKGYIEGPFCKDCRSAKPDSVYGALCARTRNLVTGEIAATPAITARMDPDMCGIDGAWFEAADEKATP